MEKNEEILTGHNLSMNDRRSLNISGVKKIDNFDDEEFVMDTIMGLLTIKGKDLELIKLDTIQGNISIKGRIDSLDYKDDVKTKENQGIINRLFK